MSYKVNITQQLPYGLLNLRGDEQVCNTFNDALGFELPRTPNTTTGKGDVSALWLGPDEWLIKTNDGDEVALAGSLQQAVAGQHAAITQLSDNYIIFRVCGAESRAVLSQGAGIDLHPQAFKPGQCARTSMGKMGVILHQLDNEASYDVYALRSYADYLNDWLAAAKGM